AAGAGLAFLIPPAEAMSERANRTWNAIMIGCVALIAASVAMAGITYNRAPERADESRNVITLSQRVLGALPGCDDSRLALTSNKDPKQIADSLRAAANELSSVPRVDDRSEEIKQQLIDLLNRRADAFAAAATAPGDRRALALAVEAELDSIARTSRS